MLQKINPIVAIKIILGFSVLVILFHLIVLLQLIPFELVWGGRLKSKEDMYVFETISIVINLLIILLVRSKQKQLRKGKKTMGVTILLAACSLLFFLNTIGNIFAEKSLETYIFTPITLLLAILFLRLVLTATVSAAAPAVGMDRQGTEKAQ